MEEDEEDIIFVDTLETLGEPSIETVEEFPGVQLPFGIFTPERTRETLDPWTSTPRMTSVEENLLQLKLSWQKRGWN